MTQAVVDMLKPIQVEKQGGEVIVLLAVAPFDASLDTVMKEHAVRKPGQCIV